MEDYDLKYSSSPKVKANKIEQLAQAYRPLPVYKIFKEKSKPQRDGGTTSNNQYNSRDFMSERVTGR